MTVTGEPARPVPEGEQPAHGGRRRDAGAVLEVCPYLASEDGGWRSAYAARQHRCHAVQPPAALAVTKQRALCLLPVHEGCATFSAARALALGDVPTAGDARGASLWPLTAGTPVVLEPARRMGALPVATTRGGGQAVLIGLMVLAFLVLVIARTQMPAASGPAAASVPGGVAGVASQSPLASPEGTVMPSPAPSVTTAPPTPSVPPSPSPTPRRTPSATAATPAPTASPPLASRSYRVRAGDTLSSIAARYDTTVKVLANLNGIADPRLIKIGQLLRVP